MFTASWMKKIKEWEYKLIWQVSLKVALLLLEHGASAKAAAKNGYTPLHIAAKKQQMDIAATLLQYKVRCLCSMEYRSH